MSRKRKSQVKIQWWPQPKQEELIEAAGLLPVFHGGDPVAPIAERIGYGGAAFGGKSDGDIGLAIAAAWAFPRCNIGFFRRTYPELTGAGGAIPRSIELLSGITRYNGGEHKHYFPNGSVLQFAHAQNENHVLRYKSLQFDILILDEATSFTWFQADYLMTRNRATCDSIITPFTVMTTNPGDVGHAWYQQTYDVLESLGPHKQVKTVMNPNEQPEKIFFIPAFIDDNIIGMERDPGYRERLMRRDPEVARALLYGDWSVFAGQAFPQWRYNRHTIDPVELPKGWPRWRSTDYGFTHPFDALWYARNPDNGRVHVYRQLNASGLTDRQQARAIKEATLEYENIAFTFASPDMWNRKNQNDIVTTAADEYMKSGVLLTRADNDRLSGKRKINRLLANLPDGAPGIVVHRNCEALIKTMPVLVRDVRNPEDVQKVVNDDAYDDLRYGMTNYNVGSVTTEDEIKERLKRPKESPLVGMRNI